MSDFDGAVAAIHRRRLAGKLLGLLLNLAGFLVGLLIVGPWLIARFA